MWNFLGRGLDRGLSWRIRADAGHKLLEADGEFEDIIVERRDMTHTFVAR